MPRAFGLRSEILVKIVLLMGAALLFAGFLLLKLTERELLTQRVESMTGAMEIIAAALSDQGSEEDPAFRATDFFETGRWLLEAWELLDADLMPLTSSSGMEPQAFPMSNSLRFSREPLIHLAYSPAWFPFGGKRESFVSIAIPLRKQGDFAGALRARFSLIDVRQRIVNAYKLVFLYAGLYGAILIGFGIYLLSGTVVRPIRRLRQGTQRIAAGDLENLLPVEGPREIADLAGSFNTMVGALKDSREKTESTIRSLRGANDELRRTRDELVRSEKMASVGHLAAGMAHEIGNPLGAVIGYIEVVRGELPDGAEKDILERSLVEAQRIDRLVRDLLDYAAPDSMEMECLDPVTVLAEARDILSHQGIFAVLRLVDNLPISLPAVFVSRHKLLQVFINLILNARDASPKGGMVRLDGGSEGEDIWLSVADEGTGISPEVMDHIFDPFYTTKAPDKGKGLGLSVCYRVIEEAGGRIAVRSAEGEGSTFTVYLKKAGTEHDGI